MNRDEAHRALQDKALAIVPGILAAKRRGDVEGVRVLHGEFMEFSRETGVAHCFALSALYVASLTVADIALREVALARGTSHQDVARLLSLNVARSQSG